MLRYFAKSQYNALPDMFVTVDMLQILEQLMSIHHRLHIWLPYCMTSVKTFLRRL